jgi:outer membrane receptor protein involved in Fe transport
VFLSNNRAKKFFAITILPILLLSINTLSAQSVTMRGTVVDSMTKAFLPGANILLLGTSIGTACNNDGKFLIRNIPPGTYKVKTSYVGYKSNEFEVTLNANRVFETVIRLKPESVEGKTVTITAQAIGQNEAINKQLRAEQITNVVSSENIQKMPDMNAADVAARLPGVSLIRDGGEGALIVIRGLAPQYNQVTIDGIQLPPNVGISGQYTESSLAGDRSTNLSMISSGILGGIEVIKSITPDMDAAVFGGIVNFDLKEAIVDSSNLPSFELVMQGGLNDLKKNYDNYRFSGTYQQRFFSRKLGLFLQGSYEIRNPGGNTLDADYSLSDKLHGDLAIPDLDYINLGEYGSRYERKDLTAVLDYKYSTGQIGFKNLLSQYDVKRENRGESIYSNAIYYSATDISDKLNSVVNIFSIKQNVPFFNIDLKLAHAYSENPNPKNLFIDFYQRSRIGDISKLTPKTVASMAVPNEYIAYNTGISDNSTFVRDRAVTTMIDFNSNYFISDLFTANVKFGGMYQYRKRSYDYNVWSGPGSYRSYLRNFLDNNYSFGNFFNGDYSIHYPIDINLENLLYKQVWTPELSKDDKFNATISDYNGTENRSAGYLIAKINFDDLLTLLPGVRYQNLTTTYSGNRVELTYPRNYSYNTATKTEAHGYWLPMVHLIYKPFSWLQVHFAYTNTLNYPSYSVIVPSYTIDDLGTYINYNNFTLKPATSENYDLVFSFYNNEIGLLTLDGFKKRIKNLVFSNQTFVTDLSAYPDMPQDRNQLYTLNTYINNPYPIDVWGIETEWQTHFWYLPEPFSWIVFNINYSHIFSQATYPKNELFYDYKEDGSFTLKIISPYYKNRLLDQPNDILNSSVGIDYKGFSGRISVAYINNIFKKADFWLQNREISDKLVRWDLSIRQELPWFKTQLFLDLINFTGANETDLNARTYYPESIDRYGMFGNFGIRINL